MINNYIAILDIGTTKLVAMVGKKNADGKLKILGYGENNSAGVTRGLILNVNEASEVISKVVNKAREESGIDFNDVYVGIAGQHISTIQTSHSIAIDDNDLITKDDVDKLIKEVYNMALSPGEKILHVFPQEYKVDNTSVKNPVGTMGRKLQSTFHITLGKDTKIEILGRSVQMVDLNIKNLVLEPVASSKAVLSDEEKEAGVALIDIGGGTTDLIIFKDNIIRYTAVIPFGGESITKDLQTGLNIVRSQAEKLKIEYGSAIADLVNEKDYAEVKGIGGRESHEISIKAIAEIIQARALEIIDTFKNELKKSSYFDKLAAGITITGGGALLKNLTQLIEFRTGLETHLAMPQNYVYTSPDAFNNPKYSTSIGLLLKGFEIEKDNQHKIIKQKQKEEKHKQEKEQLQQDDDNKQENNQNKIPENQDNNSPEKPGLKKWFNMLKDFFIDDEDESTKI